MVIAAAPDAVADQLKQTDLALVISDPTRPAVVAAHNKVVKTTKVPVARKSRDGATKTNDGDQTQRQL